MTTYPDSTLNELAKTLDGFPCYYLDAMKPEEARVIKARWPEQAAEVFSRVMEETCGIRYPVAFRVVMVMVADKWRTYYVAASWHLKYEATDADERDPEQPF